LVPLSKKMQRLGGLGSVIQKDAEAGGLGSVI